MFYEPELRSLSGIPRTLQLVPNRQLTHLTVPIQDFPDFWVPGRMTGNPHLTRRWPFERVTEGLPTNRKESVRCSYSDSKLAVSCIDAD